MRSRPRARGQLSCSRPVCDRQSLSFAKAIERTLAWIGRNRRMSRDYERLIKTSEMLLYASRARVMLRRLAKQTHAR